MNDTIRQVEDLERANQVLTRAIEMTQTVVRELNELEKRVHESHMRVLEACIAALRGAHENDHAGPASPALTE